MEQNTLGRLPGYGNKCDFGEKAKIRDGIADLAVERGTIRTIIDNIYAIRN